MVIYSPKFCASGGSMRPLCIRKARRGKMIESCNVLGILELERY